MWSHLAPFLSSPVWRVVASHPSDAILRSVAGHVLKRRTACDGFSGTGSVAFAQYGKPSVVMISAAEYERLKELDRRVMRVDDMSDEEIASNAEPCASTDYFIRL